MSCCYGKANTSTISERNFSATPNGDAVESWTFLSYLSPLSFFNTSVLTVKNHSKQALLVLYMCFPKATFDLNSCVKWKEIWFQVSSSYKNLNILAIIAQSVCGRWWVYTPSQFCCYCQNTNFFLEKGDTYKHPHTHTLTKIQEEDT